MVWLGKYVLLQSEFYTSGASNETKVNVISIHSEHYANVEERLKALMVYS
jgi:hypothetical protein